MLIQSVITISCESATPCRSGISCHEMPFSCHEKTHPQKSMVSWLMKFPCAQPLLASPWIPNDLHVSGRQSGDFEPFLASLEAEESKAPIGGSFGVTGLMVNVYGGELSQ